MSENYQVTARKWRPQKFDEVVGQDHVTRTLKNAIRENRLAHAYLFTGQRGCGKTTVARILAKAINCPNAEKNGYEPCNECEICKAITAGTSMDVSEIDGASNNSVDDVRAMRDNVKYPPLNGKYRIVIIDEVHMLSTQAFNALLKTLEEPPRHLVFIFATTEVQKVLPTILSRTQRYDFRRMQIEEIITHLRLIANADKITTDEDALLLIARKADGSMRDAQSVFDQAIAFTGGKLSAATLGEALNLIDNDFFFSVSDAIIASETNKAFSLAFDVVTRGYDIEEFLGGLLDHFRNFMTVVVTKKPSLLEVSKQHQERYTADSGNFSEGDLLRLVRIGFRAIEQLKSAPSPRMVLELALVEMTLIERAVDIRALVEELRSLKGATNELPTATPAPRGTPTSTPRTATPTPPARATKSETSAAPIATATMSSEPIDADEVMSRRDECKEFLSSRSVPFMLVSEDVDFKEVKGSQVIFAISKNHTSETLSRHKENLTNLLKEFYVNSGLSFDVLKVERSAMPKPTQTSHAPKTPNGANKANASAGERETAQAMTIDDGVERSPFELALISELGAVPV